MAMRTGYQVITDRVISLLESGTVPWHKPWGGPERRPRNLVSDRPYRGMNVFLLSAADYESPYWLTFRQAKQRGGWVRKGESGCPCVYWNWTEKTNEESGETEKHAFMKAYTVFNVHQCDEINYPKFEESKREFTPIEACERVVTDMPRAPPIHHGGDRACYQPSSDSVHMPPPERFDKPESYYGTLFHELVHSTGHASRLGRPGITDPIAFGTSKYTKEELVAEMGATFLCGHTGIENAVIDNSAAYISSWLRRLRHDNRLVVQAAAQSQKAADYVLNQKPEEPPDA